MKHTDLAIEVGNIIESSPQFTGSQFLFKRGHRYYFWQPNAHPSGSNYFGIELAGGGGVAVFDGIEQVVDKKFWGILRPDNTILYSAYRHDYRTDEYGNMVDGGQDDYERMTVTPPSRYINFKFEDNKVVEVNDKQSEWIDIEV